MAAYRVPTTNDEPFHHRHRPMATCTHQHPSTPNTRRAGCISSPHHQRRALPSPPSTHGDVRSPAPIYAQHKTRWLHIESPPPTTRPSTTDIHSRRRSTLGCKSSPHHQRRTDPAAQQSRTPTHNRQCSVSTPEHAPSRTIDKRRRAPIAYDADGRP